MNLLFNYHLWNLFQGIPLGNTGGGNDDSWVYVMETEKKQDGSHWQGYTKLEEEAWRLQTAKTTLTTKKPQNCK